MGRKAAGSMKGQRRARNGCALKTPVSEVPETAFPLPPFLSAGPVSLCSARGRDARISWISMEHPPVPSLVLSCARKVTNKNRTETLIVHCKTRKIGSLSPRGLERKTDRQRKSQPKSPQVLREHSAGSRKGDVPGAAWGLSGGMSQSRSCLSRCCEHLHRLEMPREGVLRCG